MSTSDRGSNREILAGLIGGGIFVLFFFVIIPNRLFLSIVAAAVGFLAGRLVFAPPAKVEMLAGGVTEGQLKEALEEGRKKLNTLERASHAIDNRRVRQKAVAICETTKKILDDIRQDPADLRPARKFLGYYLDATITVVQRYRDLSLRGVVDPGIQASLAKVETSLSTIQSAFEKQLAQLLENDVMNLDTEIEVLEKTIQMEGLGPDA